MHKSSGLKRIFRAFFYSMEGIGSTLKHEAAFRQEMILATILIPASFLLGVSTLENCVLIASILLVLIVELLNSAIEAAIDDISMHHRPLAKRAKDMGSAAVFISLVNCVAVWVIVVAANWTKIIS